MTADTERNALIAELTADSDLHQDLLTARAADQIRRDGERIAELEAENERLRDALAFYADVSKYPAPLTGGLGELYFDCGQIARAALAKEGRA